MVVARPPSPPPPPRQRAKERDTEIDIYTSRHHTEVDIHESSRERGRHGRGRSPSHERPSPRPLRPHPHHHHHDDEVIVRSDRNTLSVEIDERRHHHHGPHRRARSAAPPMTPRDDFDEGDYITSRINERGRMGEARHGHTKDWTIVDVPPGTERVRMDGVGGGQAEVTWQRYNGVRRARFIPDGAPDTSALVPAASGADRDRVSVQIYDKHREVDVEKVTDRRITLRPSAPQPTNRSEMWTEITKDLVVREAIEDFGYEYEETEWFFYVMRYLRYVSLSPCPPPIPSHLPPQSEEAAAARSKTDARLPLPGRRPGPGQALRRHPPPPQGPPPRDPVGARPPRPLASPPPPSQPPRPPQPPPLAQPRRLLRGRPRRRARARGYHRPPASGRIPPLTRPPGSRRRRASAARGSA